MFSPPPPLQLKFGLQHGGGEAIEVSIGRTSWKVTPGTPRSERSPKPAGYYEKKKKKPYLFLPAHLQSLLLTLTAL